VDGLQLFHNNTAHPDTKQTIHSSNEPLKEDVPCCYGIPSGGHIPIQDKNKRSFEALAAIVYRPENLQVVDLHHRRLVNKTCVISAKEDKLQTIQTYVINAALKQGISQDTHVTALADGAKNCWSVLAALQPYCGRSEYILDWFHITLKFQSVQQALGETFAESLDISENPQRVKETGFQPATADLETQPFPQRHQYLREF
jgi:hypothetical protein